MESPELFAELSRRIRGSDHAAFSKLFSTMHVALLRYAWRLTGDDQAARDVVQDAFVRIWNRRETLDPERSLKTLLYTSVRNLALNHIRDRQRRGALLAEAMLPPGEEFPADDQRMDAAVLDRKIRGWIAELPARRREAFVLSRFDRLSHEEIARVMELTPNTVGTHIMLALKHLRERLRAFE